MPEGCAIEEQMIWVEVVPVEEEEPLFLAEG